MAKPDLVKHWLSSANADLRAARSLFKNGHWRHVFFLCHLTVEKSLKAAIQKRTNRIPPKIHDLVTLVQGAGVDCPPDLDKFISRLSDLSIPTRYPADLLVAAGTYNRRTAAECLAMTGKVHRWFAQALR